MLRITQYVKASLEGRVLSPLKGVILIWNLTNRCNLYCKHCYSSANQLKDEELSYEEVVSLADELVKNGVKFAILSGGEPLLREDIFLIGKTLKEKGMRTYLSTNGLLISGDNIKEVKESFDYVGISIDGTPEVHDLFRGKRGAFEESLRAVELCLSEGIKVGLRFTLTEKTRSSLPFIFKLAEDLEVPKVYISHLVYAGRGTKLSTPEKLAYRSSVEFIIERAFSYVEEGRDIEVVTGNNETDAVLLYEKFREYYPEKAEVLYQTLKNWGGNQAGVRLVNINHRGEVRPDPFFYHSLGNIREKSFSEIWNSNGLLSELRRKPRRVKGKCSSCEYLEICNGNSRARAYYATGDYLGEDPACYL